MGRIHYEYRITYPSGRVDYIHWYPNGPLPDDAEVWEVTYDGDERVDFQKLFVVNGQVRRQLEPTQFELLLDAAQSEPQPSDRRRQRLASLPLVGWLWRKPEARRRARQQQSWVDVVVIFSRLFRRR